MVATSGQSFRLYFISSRITGVQQQAQWDCLKRAKEAGGGGATFTPGTWEAEAGKLWVPGQPGVQSDFQDN